MTTPMLGPAHSDFGKVSALPSSGAAAQVTLPSLPETRRWIERTQLERDALRVRADKLREQFEPLRKQLAGIEKSIKMLDQILGQVAVETTADDGPTTGRRPGPKPMGRWARKHDACLMCGKSEQPHKAKGYCKDCYDRRDRLQAAEGDGHD